jgi:hypothetical protein
MSYPGIRRRLDAEVYLKKNQFEGIHQTGTRFRRMAGQCEAWEAVRRERRGLKDKTVKYDILPFR